MKRYVFGLALAAGVAISCLVPTESRAVACANGVYRAGCVGPNGAAVVHKPQNYYNHNYYGRGNYYHHNTVHCARGAYHSGCVRSY